MFLCKQAYDTPLKNISVMLEGTGNDITSSYILTSRVLNNFGANKEATDFLVNLYFCHFAIKATLG